MASAVAAAPQVPQDGGVEPLNKEEPCGSCNSLISVDSLHAPVMMSGKSGRIHQRQQHQLSQKSLRMRSPARTPGSRAVQSLSLRDLESISGGFGGSCNYHG